MQATLVFPRATAAMVREHARGRVIAVDGGAQACLDAGVVPEAVVGDMDSIRPETLAEAQRRGARIERHPPAKRDTDAALALARARDPPGADEVVFLGAGGGRPDHALANLHLLAEAARWASARGVDADHATWVATPERPLELALAEGALVSAIPFDAEVSGVTYEGLGYPLSDARLVAGDPFAVSNVATAPRQRIRVGRGRLLVLHPFAP